MPCSSNVLSCDTPTVSGWGGAGLPSEPGLVDVAMLSHELHSPTPARG